MVVPTRLASTMRPTPIRSPPAIAAAASVSTDISPPCLVGAPRTLASTPRALSEDRPRSNRQVANKRRASVVTIACRRFQIATKIFHNTTCGSGEISLYGRIGLRPNDLASRDSRQTDDLLQTSKLAGRAHAINVTHLHKGTSLWRREP